MPEGRLLVQSGNDLRREDGPPEMDVGLGVVLLFSLWGLKITLAGFFVQP